jgi:alpha-beta hydrolase superfamily lysophospholipase
MRKLAFLSLLILWFVEIAAGAPGVQNPGRSGRECVFLLHGLGRSARSLEKLAAHLSSQGYSVVNVEYPTLEQSIEYLADEALHPEIERIRRSSPDKIHFVTHSMGGIVVRYYLQHHPLENLGRVVMLSPPNQGSELVDRMKSVPLIEKLLSPAARELGTDRESLPVKLGRPAFELGVIAGKKSHNPLNSLIIDGPDDGTVSVKSARIAGMNDFLVLPYSHRSILKSDEVIDQVLHFLKHGAFKREPGG